MAKTAGKTLSWITVGGLGAAAMSLKAGCAPIPHQESGSESAWGDQGVAMMVSQVLAGVGPEVVEPSLQTFAAQVDRLSDAVDVWGNTYDAGDDATAARADAQAAWTDVMMVWQEHELMQIGPAGSSLSAVAGGDLRDEIYSWPSINPCRVDQELVAAGWNDADWFQDNLVNSYGLDAIEHVLFGGAQNACPSQIDINSEGTWDALGPDGIEANRIAFARVLTDHVAETAEVLLDDWAASGGDFSGQLALTARSTPYLNDQEALNAVFDALFYLETVTKDRKLAQPLGLVECSLDACPDDSEHLESGVSTMAVAANLRGFRALFTGGAATGFDDLLAELGHADLSDEILARTDLAIEVAESMAVPVHQGVATDAESVEALHDAVKDVAELLKTDLVTVLSLEVPAEAAGDND